MPINKFLRADRRGRKREKLDSFASRNEASGRYPSKEYPGDSYYTVNKVFRQYVPKEEPRR